jgi:orotate phosphoribosyltransferase
MSSARQELLRLLATKSFRLGEFKLASGRTSDYYIDCRTTTLDARGAQLTGEVFLEEIRGCGWNAQAIGGLTMGADGMRKRSAGLPWEPTRSWLPSP